MALLFVEANTDTVDLGQSVPTFRNINAGTLMGWFTYTVAPVNIQGYCYSIGPPPGLSNNTRFEIEIKTDGHVEIDARGTDGSAGSSLSSSAGDVTGFGAVYHVAITVDWPNNLGTIYVNGVQVAQGTLTPGITGTATSDTDSKSASIGSSEALDSQFHNGKIEDCRAYTRILSPAEIASIHRSIGHDGIVFGLIDRYVLDDLANGQVAGGVANAAQRQTPGTGVNTPTYVEAVAIAPRRRVP